MPVNEMVTTNYDELLENACEAVKRPVSVLPRNLNTRTQRWLLKMHGCVSHPEDIVLTRSSYLRYSVQREALAGIVQALLITRQMCFVGFGLEDDNFHRVVDAVRRATEGAKRSNTDDPHLGYATALQPMPVMETLWKDEIRWISLGPAPGEKERGLGGNRKNTSKAARAKNARLSAASRAFDIFLDRVSAEAATAAHLLVPGFAATLTEQEEELRDLLLKVEVASQGVRNLPAWTRIGELLASFGSVKSGSSNSDKASSAEAKK